MQKESFRASINGLRGLAILMVVFYHWSHLKGGFTGVDVFFVISGYLISAIIFRDLTKDQFSFAGFYAKRTRRIIPSLIVILLFAIGIGWFRYFSDQFLILGKHIQAGALFLSNFRLYSEAGYFDAAAETKLLLQLWSLAVEEQFYLFWPVFLWASYKIFRSVLGAMLFTVVLSFAANIYFSTRDTSLNFYMMPTRLWELALGGIVFMSQPRLQKFYDSNAVQLSGILLILIGTFTIRGQTGFPGAMALVPTVGTGLLLGASENALINRSILSSRLLGFFGTISFPLYLWHWSLYSFMKSMTLHASAALLAVGTLLFSYLTHRFIEKPFMNFPITARNRIKVVLAGIAALSVIGIIGTLIGNGSIKAKQPNTFPLLKLKEAEGPDPGCSISADFGSAFSSTQLKSCGGRRFSGAPTILLLGDSHASSLSKGLFAFGEENGVNVIAMSAMYCTPLSSRDRRPACRDFNKHMNDWIAELKPDLVLLFAYHWLAANSENYDEPVPYPKFMAMRLQEIKKLTGKEVLLVGPIPTWQISLLRVVNIAFLSKSLPVPQYTFEGLSKEAIELDQVMKEEASHYQVPYFSLKEELCAQQGCMVRVGERIEADFDP